MINYIVLYLASSEHGVQWSSVQLGIKSDVRQSWTHVSSSSETRREHSHVTTDAADTDTVSEGRSISQTSDDVS